MTICDKHKKDAEAIRNIAFTHLKEIIKEAETIHGGVTGVLFITALDTVRMFGLAVGMDSPSEGTVRGLYHEVAAAYEEGVAQGRKTADKKKETTT